MTTYNMRTFYTIILTQTLSLIGSQISGLALGIWVFQDTGNATPLALVAFFAIVPQVVLSSLAGVLADRWDRRYVMAISDIGQAAGSLLLLILFVSGSFQIWHLYAVTLFQAMFGVFQHPAFSASVTMLVPDEHRDRANAIRQMTQPAAGIVAPAVAGIIFAALGVVGAIVIDLISFLLAVGVILTVHIPKPRKTQEGAAVSGSLWRDLSAGFRYLWQRQVLFWVLMGVMLLNFTFGFDAIILTPYVLSRTGSETVYGFIMSLFNAGMLVGAIIIGIWGGTRPRIHTIMVAAIGMGIFTALLGMARSVPMLAVIAFLMLLPNAFANSLFMSMLQVKIAPDVQGRVFAMIGQIAMLITPLAYLTAGPLADKVFEPMVGQPGWERWAPFFGSEAGAGMGMMFFIAGTISALVSIVMYAHPAVRSMEATLPDYEPYSVESETAPDLAVA